MTSISKPVVKSCSHGVRGGAATLSSHLHLEVESLLVLKNNRGVEENRKCVI
jgi:ribonucleoside-diphosphate reductase alpha chain